MRIIDNNSGLEFFYYRFKRPQFRNNKCQYATFPQSASEKKKGKLFRFHVERAVSRPLARNDLSFQETVVGFIAGLNFPRQGQRSDLSDGRGERAG